MKVTTKTVQSTFKNIDAKTARIIVRLCNGTLDPEDFDEGKRRLRECYNRPSDTDLILNVVNKLVDGHGVEGTPWKRDAMYERDFISYVNMGDAYAATVLFHPGKRCFVVASWADVYEDNPDCKEVRDEDEDEIED